MTFEDQFPVLRNYNYLNTAKSGILSERLSDWRKTHDQEFMNLGSGFRLNHAKLIQEVKHNLARFFNAKEDYIYLSNNFSSGLNVLLDGLSADHRFLLLQGDYPSINYPVESRGFICDYALINGDLEDNILRKVKEFKPSVLAISLVQYNNGIKINLDFIKQLKSHYPDLLIIADGTQFCATQRFDFETSGLDVLIFSGYKWVLAGYGNAVLFFKDEISDRIYPQRSGYSMPKEAFLKGKKRHSFYFEPGHLDTLNFGTLNQSILFLEELGIDFIENQIRTISIKAKEAFSLRGLLAKEVAKREEHSSIFNLLLEEKTIKRIEEANIIFSAHGDGIRVSFHFYNTESNLNHLLEMIDSE
ncbi:aminotransferase class V-fold PLP-dependent enzyme [Pedobacter sp. PAMC26386]|nr:aminotransferase class V-fold PLP-dependent enzyme [Pedobacter sp. PAMC26386]